MLINRKGAASFGTIVGIFGSVLIALGIAWLIAQNWHQIPSALKIIILLGATSAAYVLGTVFRVREYVGMGKALLVLGALLYTLSIFLIAQIFFTSASWQGTAWLWLIGWAGVLAASFIFDSPESYAVVSIEYVIWVFIQTFAFFETSGIFGSGGMGHAILIPFFTVTGLALAVTGSSVLYMKGRGAT